MFNYYYIDTATRPSLTFVFSQSNSLHAAIIIEHQCILGQSAYVIFPDASFTNNPTRPVNSFTLLLHHHTMSQSRAVSRSRPSGRSTSPSPVSRPTTPLRPSSRSSFRTSQNNAISGVSPLDALEPQFAELGDSVADLEANFMHLQLMHESLSRFGESFASFLYGLNMNAFVVDFPEVCSNPYGTSSLLIVRYRHLYLSQSNAITSVGDKQTWTRLPSRRTMSQRASRENQRRHS